MKPQWEHTAQSGGVDRNETAIHNRQIGQANGNRLGDLSKPSVNTSTLCSGSVSFRPSRKRGHGDSDKNKLGFIRRTEISNSISDPLFSIKSKTSAETGPSGKSGIHEFVYLNGVRQVERGGEEFLSARTGVLDRRTKPGRVEIRQQQVNVVNLVY